MIKISCQIFFPIVKLSLLRLATQSDIQKIAVTILSGTGSMEQPGFYMTAWMDRVWNLNDTSVCLPNCQRGTSSSSFLFNTSNWLFLFFFFFSEGFSIAEIGLLFKGQEVFQKALRAHGLLKLTVKVLYLQPCYAKAGFYTLIQTSH